MDEHTPDLAAIGSSTISLTLVAGDLQVRGRVLQPGAMSSTVSCTSYAGLIDAEPRIETGIERELPHGIPERSLDQCVSHSGSARLATAT
jgi:hypothetical protein